MGCFWSNEEHDRCTKCNRKEVNGLVIINHVCEICIHRTETESAEHKSYSSNGPYFGKFRCKSCKRCWDSRLCWPNKYQLCKRCRIPIYPNYIRELRSTDMSKSNNTVQDHQKELCQMCQQLGYYCNRNEKRSKFKNR